MDIFKKFFGSLIFVVFLGIAPVFSLETGNLNLELNVKTVFSIELNRTDIDFETMRPGETKRDIPAAGIKVTTKSNTANKWYLYIQSLSELRDNDQYIEKKNFKWYGFSEGNGRWAEKEEAPLELTPVLAYESSIQEGITSGINHFFKFKLTVPEKQLPGRYTSVIKFTLTE